MFDSLQANQAIEVEYERDVNGWVMYDYFIYNPPVLSRLHGTKVYNVTLPEQVEALDPVHVSYITWEEAFERSVVGNDGLNETEREQMAREYEEKITKPLTSSDKEARMKWLAQHLKGVE